MIADDLTITSIEPTTPVVKLANSNPFGFRYQIYDVGAATPATNSITVKLDGNPIVLTGLSQSGNIGGGDGSGVTTVVYDSPTAIFALGSTHTNVVQFSGSGFSNVT